MKSVTLGLFFLVMLLHFTSVCHAVNLCYEYSERRDYDKSIEECTKQINDDAWDKSIAYNNRGIANKAKGNYNQAISDYDRAIELNREYANAYNNRGVVHYAIGNLDQAISDYNKAIELNPKHVNAYSNRGLAHKAKGYYEQAVSDYTIAMVLDPEDEYVYIDAIIVSAHLSEDKYKLALKRLKNYMRWRNSSEWIRVISKYYLGVDRLAEKDVLREATKCENKQEMEERLCEAYYYLGEKRLLEGNRKGAEEFFRKSVDTRIYSFIEYQNSLSILVLMKEGKI
jgi:lipoprotein NlpI